MDWLGGLKTLLSVFNHPLKIMAAVCLLFASALFLPQTWQQKMGIMGWTQEHRVIEWSGFVFFVILLVSTAIETIWKKHSTSSGIEQRLSHLTDPEKRLLRSLNGAGFATVIAWPYEEHVVSLFMDGLITRSPDGLPNGQFAYCLPLSMRKHLKKAKM